MLKGLLILLAMTAVALSACMAIVALGDMQRGEGDWRVIALIVGLGAIGVWLWLSRTAPPSP